MIIFSLPCLLSNGIPPHLESVCEESSWLYILFLAFRERVQKPGSVGRKTQLCRGENRSCKITSFCYVINLWCPFKSNKLSELRSSVSGLTWLSGRLDVPYLLFYWGEFSHIVILFKNEWNVLVSRALCFYFSAVGVESVRINVSESVCAAHNHVILLSCAG